MVLFLNWLFVGLSVLLLTACGGSKPALQNEAKPASAAPKAARPAPSGPDERPAIVAFGNSLTAGFGVDAGSSYPDYLQKELDSHGYHYRVVNSGVSGDTTTDGLNRVGEVLLYKPAVVVVEFGGNDGLRGLPLETTQENLAQILWQLVKAHVQLVLAGMTLPPNYGPEYVKPFEAIYSEAAAKYKIPYIPFLLAGVGANPDLMQADGLHANPAGNAIVAKTVFKALEPVLHK